MLWIHGAICPRWALHVGLQGLRCISCSCTVSWNLHPPPSFFLTQTHTNRHTHTHTHQYTRSSTYIHTHMAAQMHTWTHTHTHTHIHTLMSFFHSPICPLFHSKNKIQLNPRYYNSIKNVTSSSSAFWDLPCIWH